MLRFEDWEDLPYNFSTDLFIASGFGKDAVIETVENAREQHKDDYKVLTRLEFDVNWMCWYHYENGNNEMSELFADMYYNLRGEFYEKFDDNKDALEYHFEKLD